MNRDPTTLLSIQLALMGIVVVVGFFFVWRHISRLEAKLDQLSVLTPAKVSTSVSCPIRENGFEGCPLPVHENSILYKGGSVNGINNIYQHEEQYEDEEEEDEDVDFSVMKACFGDITLESLIDDARTTFMVLNTEECPISKKDGVVLEEMTEEQETKPASKKGDRMSSLDEEVSNEDTETNEYSRHQLRKMHLDTLRDMCSSRGLPTDGTKMVLVDRIIASFPSA